jgi:hypothetical protein
MFEIRTQNEYIGMENPRLVGKKPLVIRWKNPKKNHLLSGKLMFWEKNQNMWKKNPQQGRKTTWKWDGRNPVFSGKDHLCMDKNLMYRKNPLCMEKPLIRIKTNAYVNGKKTSVRKEPINVQTMQHLVTSANTSDANWKNLFM